MRTRISASGFEPAEATRAPGQFRLTVLNESGVETLSLKLSRVDGTEVRSGQTAAGASEWVENLDLPAGRYVLTEASHPSWVFYLNLL